MSTGSIANLVQSTMPLLLGSPDATPNVNGSLAQVILDRTAPGAICDANGKIARLPPAIKNSLRLATNLSANCQSFRVPKNRGRMIKSLSKFLLKRAGEPYPNYPACYTLAGLSNSRIRK